LQKRAGQKDDVFASFAKRQQTDRDNGKTKKAGRKRTASATNRSEPR
jgi:hypothetical protein